MTTGSFCRFSKQIRQVVHLLIQQTQLAGQRAIDAVTGPAFVFDHLSGHVCGDEFLCVFPEQSLETGTRAVRRMQIALESFIIEGVTTTIPFLARVMENPRFRAGEVDTKFLERETDLLKDPGQREAA